jgi:hypothetical protein
MLSIQNFGGTLTVVWTSVCGHCFAEEAMIVRKASENYIHSIPSRCPNCDYPLMLTAREVVRDPKKT